LSATRIAKDKIAQVRKTENYKEVSRSIYKKHGSRKRKVKQANKSKSVNQLSLL